MTYDPVHNLVLLFGGTNGTASLSDTWTWDGATWTQQNPALSPPARNRAGLAYDSSRNTAVLFGGLACPISCSSSLGDTWTWDGLTWTQQHPAAGPTARIRAGLAFDAAHSVMVLFGGCCAHNGYDLADTWIWNGSNWTQQTPSTNPPARRQAAMAYDTIGQNVELFGGFICDPTGSTCGNLNDTWSWNGSTWSQQLPATSPPVPGNYANMVYDAAVRSTLLFGIGRNGNDTWTLSDPGSGLVGDVNGNRQVNAVDALYVLRYIASLPITGNCRLLPLGSGDPIWHVSTSSGPISAVDALCILRNVAGLPATTVCQTIPLGLQPSAPYSLSGNARDRTAIGTPSPTPQAEGPRPAARPASAR
ncbi:MAG: hypothetical protein ACR2PL_17455 [Dehalococcoidia bacterium]